MTVDTVNGWKTHDKKWMADYFRNAAETYNNAYFFNNAESWPQFKKQIRNDRYLNLDMVFMNEPRDSIIKHISLDMLNGEKYIYPIRLIGMGSVRHEIELGNAYYIPQRVIDDCNSGICKILFHELWEGHGQNLTLYKSFFEKIAADYNIPMSCIGFMDNNYLTPELQKSYGSRGIFCMNFESMHMIQHHKYKVFIRLTKMKNRTLRLPYRFINLNRRNRPHRIIVTNHLYNNWDKESLWSFTEATRSITHPHESPGKLSDEYIKQLPKILDIDDSVNDIGINPDLQKGAFINLVSETSFYHNQTKFLTEKTFKPIRFGQLFIIIGNAGSLRMLKEAGYKTFHPYINETYDSIADPAERMVAILAEIDRLGNLSESEFLTLLSATAPIVMHNWDHAKKNVGSLRATADAIEQIKDWYNE